MDIPSRRERAKVAVEAYIAANPDYSDEPGISEEVVADLLADLMHLCRKEEIDSERAFRMAEVHVEEEI